MVNRGVKKVSENIAMKGRSFIVTKDDVTSTEWGDLENGTLRVDDETGDLYVKLKGETDWIPLPYNSDTIVNIARDNINLIEVFTIVSKDNGDGTFTYKNEEGNNRVAPFDGDGWHVFEVEKGTYIMNRNRIEATIDDTLHRSEASGGLKELDDRHVAIPQMEPGTEITVKYTQKINMESPFPRIVISETAPSHAAFGDLWIEPEEAKLLEPEPEEPVEPTEPIEPEEPEVIV